MGLWFLFSASLLFSLLILRELLRGQQANQNLPNLTTALFLLHEIEESLQTGLIPRQETFAQIRLLPTPWGTLIGQSLDALQESGSAVLPSVQRYRQLILGHLQDQERSSSQSASARVQAVVSAILIPAVSLTLYALLPALQKELLTWALLTILAWLLVACGARWMWHLSLRASWGRLSAENRHYPLLIRCAGEYLLALVHSGQSVDRAWQQVYDWLRVQDLSLSSHWGASCWSAGAIEVDENRSRQQRLPQSMTQHLIEIRRTVQNSLLEGRPCTERLSTSLDGLERDFRQIVERELALLPSRCLKPLFVFVAPAVLGMMVAGVFLGVMGDPLMGDPLTTVDDGYSHEEDSLLESES